LARLQLRPFRKGQVRGPERNRDAGRLLHADSLREQKAGALGNDGLRRVAAARRNCNDGIPYTEMPDIVADLDDFA
jgi:hypothetical protein